MFLRLKRFALGLGAAAALTGAATLQSGEGRAEEQPKAVVELFTSQGCSSCPPADAMLGKLAKRDDIIALTLPVDYWDYLGWKDTLANPAFSARQRAYARARGDGQVYTPQMVIDGNHHVVGSHGPAIKQAIGASREKLKDMRVALRIWIDGDTVVIKAGAAPEGAKVKPATIWLALVKAAETVKISRGENRGKTITYFRVVRDMTPIGHWTGKEVTITLPKHHLKNRGADGCTVLLQEDTAGPVLAAAEMRSWEAISAR